MMIIRVSIAKAHDSVFNRASVHTLNVLYIYVCISVYIHIYIIVLRELLMLRINIEMQKGRRTLCQC